MNTKILNNFLNCIVLTLSRKNLQRKKTMNIFYCLLYVFGWAGLLKFGLEFTTKMKWKVESVRIYARV